MTVRVEVDQRLSSPTLRQTRYNCGLNQKLSIGNLMADDIFGRDSRRKTERLALGPASDSVGGGIQPLAIMSSLHHRNT